MPLHVANYALPCSKRGLVQPWVPNNRQVCGFLPRQRIVVGQYARFFLTIADNAVLALCWHSAVLHFSDAALGSLDGDAGPEIHDPYATC